MKITESLHVSTFATAQASLPLPPPPPNVNHLFICDVSGSMYEALPHVVKGVKEKLRQLKRGDSVSLAWFSSSGGDYRFVLKGAAIDGEESLKKIDASLDQFRTRGMTCFSEVLTDAAAVVDDLKGFNGPFALCFLTDGYPTVYPVEKEIQSTLAALAKLQKKVASAVFVGYGPYYNKEVLGKMAGAIGGSVIHSEKFADFPPEYGMFIDRARGVDAGRVIIDVPIVKESLIAAFCVDGGAVVMVEAVEGGLSVPKDAKSVTVITTEASGSAGAKKAKKGAADPKEVPERELYAAALVLSQQCRGDLCLEVLGKLRDRTAIDLMANAFTNAEYGAAETIILGGVRDEKKRRIGGEAPAKYLPKRDAFCLVDLIGVLQKDEEATFLPKHPAFQYRRIGAPTTVRDGYPKFQPDDGKNAQVPFGDVVWHDTMLNLSIRAVIPGHVVLPNEVDPSIEKDVKAGSTVLRRPSSIGPKFDTFQWRNYALVRAGALNVEELPITVSESTFKLLQEEKLIKKGLTYFEGNVYVIDLTKIPVMNRATADTAVTNPAVTATLAVDELRYMAEQKVTKFLFEQAFPKAERTFQKRTPEETAFLAACGIRPDGSYGPPVNLGETTDFFMAPTFELKAKGFSSLPSVNEVLKKLEDPKAKKLTPAQQMIANALERIGHINLKTAAAFEGYLAGVKRGLWFVRSDLQRSKFAILLGKRWFDGWTSREGQKVVVDNIEVSFVLGEEKVEF